MAGSRVCVACKGVVHVSQTLSRRAGLDERVEQMRESYVVMPYIVMAYIPMSYTVWAVHLDCAKALDSLVTAVHIHGAGNYSP